MKYKIKEILIAFNEIKYNKNDKPTNNNNNSATNEPKKLHKISN